MITIRFSGRVPTPRQASIGMETDQNAEKLRFALPQVADDQTAQLMMLLPDGTPEAVNIRDGLAAVSAAMTEQPGRIRAWVEILGEENSVAWNSEMMFLDVGDLPPISERTERKYPTAIQDALRAEARAIQYWETAEALRQDGETARTAAQKIIGMTAGAHTVAHGAGSSATLSEVDGHYHIEFGSEQGAPGRDGAVQTLGDAEFAFHIDENGHLIMDYGGNTPPPFEIDSRGHLIYNFSGQSGGGGDTPTPSPAAGIFGSAVFGTAVFA
ncbi:MAG: hypothetical protein IJI53_09740 [Clostridia bacterium]|nr:hypothetical protein [Clostridia bacterium]MBR0408304.1 hypothetical protein [Clostridia bacterium]